jgi:thiol:disulfide interchange protein DsbD
MTPFRLLLALLLCSSILLAGPSEPTADTFNPETAVPVEVLMSHEGLAPGEPAQLAAVFRVPAKYHITDIANGLFYVEADTLEGLRLDNIRYPDPIVDEHGDKVYRGDVVVKADINLTADVSSLLPWTVRAGFQVCSETGALTCYLPVDKEFPLSFAVVANGAAMTPANPDFFGAASVEQPATAANTADSEGLEGRLQDALASGSFLAFLIVFVLGILSSMTPCVYPMIPITISFIGARSEGSRWTGFIQSVWFVVGMALVFSTLGLIAAATGGVFGAAGQSPLFLVGLAIVFLVLAASMFGAFELQLPSTWMEKLPTGRKSGPLGAILMGGLMGFIAAPCVGPVIATLLLFIANSGSMVGGFFLMLAYSLGMGSLFLVIGTFAGALNVLPGSGSWMETVKHFFGVVMVAMALWFLRTLIPAEVMVYLVGGGLVIFGVFSDAFTPLPEEASKGARFIKAIGIIAVLLGARYLIFGLGGPVAGVAGGAVGGQPAAAVHAEVPWTVSSPESDIHAALLADAATQGKPVLMDFWAEWCVQCKELDHKTWSDPGVMQEAARFVPIKMDMTRTSSDWAKTQNQGYNIVGMPTVILFDATGHEVKRFNGFRKPAEVLEMLKAIP